MDKTFEQIAVELEEACGTHYCRDEEFFICPECGEPIHKEDYPDNHWDICPVCEADYDELV